MRRTAAGPEQDRGPSRIVDSIRVADDFGFSKASYNKSGLSVRPKMKGVSTGPLLGGRSELSPGRLAVEARSLTPTPRSGREDSLGVLADTENCIHVGRGQR